MIQGGEEIPSFTSISSDFWASRGLYFDFAWVWFNFSYCCAREGKKRSIRGVRDSLRNIVYWNFRVRSVSSSHVHCRNGRRYSSVLYFSHNNYCGPHWD